MRPQRVAALDGVRGIAVASVMIYHCLAWSVDARAFGPVGRALVMAARPGWLGVDLFFVLSGFLITGVLLDGKGTPGAMRIFYLRRALRILPAYYLVLALLVALHPEAWRFALAGLVYLCNVSPLLGIPMDYGPLWSLSVEEHFYLVWPWLVGYARARTVAAVAIALVLVEPLVRVYAWYGGGEVYGYTWFRLDELALGALLALADRAWPPRRIGRLAASALGLGLLIGAVGLPFGIATRATPVGAALQFVPPALSFFALIAHLRAHPDGRVARALSFRPLRRVGDLSYFLYLIHMMVIETWDRVVGPPHPAPGLAPLGYAFLRLAGVAAISLVLAALSQRFLEGPALALKERLSAPSPSARAAL